MGLAKTDTRRFYPWAAFISFVSWFMIAMYNYDFTLLKSLSGDTGSTLGFTNVFFFSGFAAGALAAILIVSDRYYRKVLLSAQVVWVTLSLVLLWIRHKELFYVIDTFWGITCGIIIILLIYDAIFVTPFDKWMTYVVYAYLVIQAIIYLTQLFPAGSHPVLAAGIALLLQVAVLILSLNNKTDRIEIRMEIPPARLSAKSIFIPLTTLFFVYFTYSIIKNVIHPTYSIYDGDVAAIQIIPNYLTLLLFLLLGKKLKDTAFLTAGITLLGLSFIVYLTASHSLSSRILLDFFIQPAYLFIDVFVYSYIGKIIYKYGKIRTSGRILLLSLFLTTALSEPVSTFVLHEIVKTNIQTSAMFFIIIIGIFLLLPTLEKGLDREFSEQLGDGSLQISPNLVVPLSDCPYGIGSDAAAVSETCPDTKAASVLEDELQSPAEQDSSYHKNSEELFHELLLLLPDNIALTPREKEVLFLVTDGQDDDIIASRLGISRNTLKIHIKNILAKYDVPNRKQLLALCSPPSDSVLTENEKTILRMLEDGRCRDEIAKELFISAATAKVYIWRAKKKAEHLQ